MILYILDKITNQRLVYYLCCFGILLGCFMAISPWFSDALSFGEVVSTSFGGVSLALVMGFLSKFEKNSRDLW